MRVLLIYQKGPERDSILRKVTEQVSAGLGLELQVSDSQPECALLYCRLFTKYSVKTLHCLPPTPRPPPHWGSILLLSFLPHQPLWGPGGPPRTRPLTVLSVCGAALLLVSASLMSLNHVGPATWLLFLKVSNGAAGASVRVAFALPVHLPC